MREPPPHHLSPASPDPFPPPQSPHSLPPPPGLARNYVRYHHRYRVRADPSPQTCPPQNRERPPAVSAGSCCRAFAPAQDAPPSPTSPSPSPLQSHLSNATRVAARNHTDGRSYRIAAASLPPLTPAQACAPYRPQHKTCRPRIH